MAKRKKQQIEENKVEKESLVFNLKINETPMTLEEVVVQEEFINESFEEESVVEEIIQTEPAPRSIENLSYKELKLFRRTGRMPK